MYYTSQIADFLGVARASVNYYIREGHLKAIKKDGFYRISKDDYYSFRNNYFDDGKRNSKRGPLKKFTDEQIVKIDKMIHDTTNNYISLEEFKIKYEDEFRLYPIYESLLKYKIEASK